MWWMKRADSQPTLCCTVTPEYIVCSIFSQRNELTRLEKHAVYTIDYPYLIDGQLYNQTIVTKTITEFLGSQYRQVRAYLALDSSVVYDQYVITESADAELVRSADFARQPAMMVIEEQITHDAQGRCYSISSALPHVRYIPFLSAFSCSDATLVVAVSALAAYMIGFKTCDAAAFQEALAVDVATKQWGLRSEAGTPMFATNVAVCSDGHQQLTDHMVIQYGLYQIGRRMV